jgi:hypothetical protein
MPINQWFNLLTAQPDSMALLGTLFQDIIVSETHCGIQATYWTSVRKLCTAKQKSSTQGLRSSNDQDHADGDVEDRCLDAFKEAIGNGSNVTCVKAPRVSHGITRVAIHLQVASQGLGAVNVYKADMHCSCTSTSTDKVKACLEQVPVH